MNLLGLSAASMRRALPALLAALLMAGCSAKKPETPQAASLAVSAVASSDLNPDSTGRASPLVIRIYALRALADFQKADFFALYDRDEEVLAADLVKRDEIIIQPGKTITLEREFPPDVKHVAVIGAFRDVARANWRNSTNIKPGSTGVLLIRADANSVDISVESSKGR